MDHERLELFKNALQMFIKDNYHPIHPEVFEFSKVKFSLL